MAFKARKAKRSLSKLRIGLFAPSGHGKTMSALRLAKGLHGGNLEGVYVIDTEQGSSDLYDHLGEFKVVDLDKPYDPRRYIEAIEYCAEEGAQTIIIDSISHEWEGEGGCLDLHKKVTNADKYKNSFKAWEKITPLHQRFIQTILNSPTHMICCGRKKIEYVIEQNDRGKNTPVKKGMKDITREGFDYELTVSFDIDETHNAKATKDRTGLFMSADDTLPFLITEQTGQQLGVWLDGSSVD